MVRTNHLLQENGSKKHPSQGKTDADQALFSRMKAGDFRVPFMEEGLQNDPPRRMIMRPRVKGSSWAGAFLVPKGTWRTRLR
jgi:hypothetical protein